MTEHCHETGAEVSVVDKEHVKHILLCMALQTASVIAGMEAEQNDHGVLLKVDGHHRRARLESMTCDGPGGVACALFIDCEHGDSAYLLTWKDGQCTATRYQLDTPDGRFSLNSTVTVEPLY